MIKGTECKSSCVLIYFVYEMCKLTSEKCCHVTRTSPPGTLEILGPSLVAVHLLKLSVPYQNCTLIKYHYYYLPLSTEILVSKSVGCYYKRNFCIAFRILKYSNLVGVFWSMYLYYNKVSLPQNWCHQTTWLLTFPVHGGDTFCFTYCYNNMISYCCDRWFSCLLKVTNCSNHFLLLLFSQIYKFFSQ